jgi:hypothetical protein
MRISSTSKSDWATAYDVDRKVTHCVVYRTGGTDNFKWHRTVAATKNGAMEMKSNVERMGYFAMITNYNQSLAIGLPEGYDVDSADYSAE